MKSSRPIKSILYGLIYGFNLLWALCLWLAGLDGNIMLGILLIVLYRSSLWFAPVAVTFICWLPSRPKLPLRKKLIMNGVLLLACGILSVICYLIFGNWY